MIIDTGLSVTVRTRFRMRLAVVRELRVDKHDARGGHKHRGVAASAGNDIQVVADVCDRARRRNPRTLGRNGRDRHPQRDER